MAADVPERHLFHAACEPEKKGWHVVVGAWSDGTQVDVFEFQTANVPAFAQIRRDPHAEVAVSTLHVADGYAVQPRGAGKDAENLGTVVGLHSIDIDVTHRPDPGGIAEAPDGGRVTGEPTVAVPISKQVVDV